jgi:hypothetical protein
MTPARLHGLTFTCLLMAHVLAPGRATAELIAYEPFDYTESTQLVGANGGTGFASAWAPGGFNAKLYTLFHLSPGGLTYPGLATQGGVHVNADPATTGGIAGLGRAWAKPLGAEDGTYYLSFLHRPDGEEDFGSVVLGAGTGNELAIGKSASTGMYYISNRGGTGRVLSDIAGEVGRTRLVVVKMEFQPGADRCTLYVDPVPGQPEPANGVVKEDLDLLADKIFLYSRAAWSVDEIRLGTAWEDVTPAGENAAVAGGKAMIAGRKAMIWVVAILVAVVVVGLPLVIIGFIAYRRGQQKGRTEALNSRDT